VRSVCAGKERTKVCGLCGRPPGEDCPRGKSLPLDRNPKQMEAALRILGYSQKTGKPRFGPKAQIARWGLGEDSLPEEGDKKT
jgi:hypothetical protein